MTNGLESAPVLTRACDLVIFDCDGVLVDSERISGRVFSEQLAELGLVFTLPEMIETFMGSSMQRCVDIVTERLGRTPPADLLDRYHVRMREVVARVRALLRRVERAAELAAGPGGISEVGDLVIDRGARRVMVDGQERHLTPTEFDILALLAKTPGQVVSRERLLAEVWGWSDAGGTRTVDSHVRGLRAKVGAERIRTAHAVGYALETGQ